MSQICQILVIAIVLIYVSEQSDINECPGCITYELVYYDENGDEIGKNCNKNIK